MRVLWPALIITIIIVTFVSVRYCTDRVYRRRMHPFVDWEKLAGDAKLDALRDLTQSSLNDHATWTRVAVTAAISVIAGGTLLFAWLSDISEETHDATDRNCEIILAFANGFDRRITDEIRLKQAQRDNLAMEIVETPTELRQLEGFTEMPAAVQEFFGSLLESELTEAQAQLEQYDTDLEALRTEVDDIREFVRETNCPRS